ncbi:hypothetical protein C2S52_021924, partial [Perilla frutescens var. hirtella]
MTANLPALVMFLFWFLLVKLAFACGFVFMDELKRAVEQFIPPELGVGGSESAPGPGPSSAVVPFSGQENNQKLESSSSQPTGVAGPSHAGPSSGGSDGGNSLAPETGANVVPHIEGKDNAWRRSSGELQEANRRWEVLTRKTDIKQANGRKLHTGGCVNTVANRSTPWGPGHLGLADVQKKDATRVAHPRAKRTGSACG